MAFGGQSSAATPPSEADCNAASATASATQSSASVESVRAAATVESGALASGDGRPLPKIRSTAAATDNKLVRRTSTPPLRGV